MLAGPSISVSFIVIIQFITLESKGYTDISYQWCFLIVSPNLAPHSKQISPSAQGGSWDK